ncbi:Ribbon-helix-helix protein, copG family [Haloechinothrix alba]|uniref:Ribbon-helix-helix protein, copG family n=1 Tax=Haloechinothrix alba TaxID=664784 RepID=A0A238WTI2_9PSEU|nr:ribbon-helix-helix protein, CopG family [Haloechinothrix alba]SNR49671.1 Ribbon-helix-helix protein, copG family [Haloechinothrix alba]
MATLSTKIPRELAEAFERIATDKGVSTSRLLRELVEMRVHRRVLIVEDEEVEETLGYLFYSGACHVGCALED